MTLPRGLDIPTGADVDLPGRDIEDPDLDLDPGRFDPDLPGWPGSPIAQGGPYKAPGDGEVWMIGGTAPTGTPLPRNPW